jgi:hypothetical protein
MQLYNITGIKTEISMKTVEMNCSIINFSLFEHACISRNTSTLSGRRISQSDCSIYIKLDYFLLIIWFKYGVSLLAWPELFNRPFDSELNNYTR